MNKLYKLSVERKLELEEELFEYLSNGKELSELLLKYNLANSKYLIEAMHMPINEVAKYIHIYDNSSPKLDELVFVNKLAEHYRVSQKDIINRIKEVRKINKLYEKKQMSESLVKTRKKLFRTI